MLETSRKGKRGGFFGVDRRTWGLLCDSATINEASAYLVLAQGTGADNRFTSWSATALKAYAGISWERGNAAIDGLAGKQFLRKTETSTKNNPRYELLSASEVAAAMFIKKQDGIAPDESLLLTEIREGRAKLKYGKRGNYNAFGKLAARGLVRHQGDTIVAVEAHDSSVDPDLIWLPNTLITGTDRGEDSPVRRLRSAGDIWTLRLLIDLYHAHNLRDDGGINPRVLQGKYSRMLVGEQGIFNVWAFKRESHTAWWEGCFQSHQARIKEPNKDHPIWESVAHLERQGLLTFVPHLWDNECGGKFAEAEIIHSYGIGGGEELEVAIGSAAHQAALAMVPEFKREKAVREGYCYFAPVKNTLPNVQMIGVARLLYRPHTRRTRDWFGELSRNGQRWTREYQELRERAENTARKTA